MYYSAQHKQSHKPHNNKNKNNNPQPFATEFGMSSYQGKSTRLPQIWKDISEHRNKIGLIVGRGGCNLKEIQNKTGAKVWVNRERLYIRGDREQMDAAVTAASELIRSICKNYRAHRASRRRHEPQRKPAVRVQIVDNTNAFAALDSSDDEEEPVREEYPQLSTADSSASAMWVEPTVSPAVFDSTPTSSRIKELVRAAKSGEKPKLARRPKVSWADLADAHDEKMKAKKKKVSWADMDSSSDEEEEEDLFLGSY